MRRWALVGLLLVVFVFSGGVFSGGVFSGGGSARADEGEAKGSKALQVAEAKELLAKAASAPEPLLRLMAKLGARLSLSDLLNPNVDVSITAATVLLGGTPRLDERDFELVRTATPLEFMAALAPTEVRAGTRVAKHAYASILHPEYVRQLTINTNGRVATGVVQFRAPGVYEGTLHYIAHRTADGWRVVELRFEHSRVYTTLEKGRWRLRVPPKADEAGPQKRGLLRLPRVGTVGSLPPAATRVTVSVARDGWIRVPDRREPLSLRALERYLAARTSAPGLRERDGSSRLDVLLDIDATTPWILTQWIMMTCAHPTVKAYRISLGAATREGGHRGAIATRLPKDRGITPTPRFPEHFVKHKLKVFKRSGAAASDMRAIYAALSRRHAATGRKVDTKFEIVAPPPKGGAVPHGYVVQLIDVCLAVGAQDILFEGAALPTRSMIRDAGELKRHIDEVRARPGVPMVKLDNNRSFVGADGEGLPAVPAQGALGVRWGAGASLMAEVVEEVLEEAIEEEVVKEPKLRKGKGDLPFEESFGETEGLSDAPFEGPANNGTIGIGGGAAGAFRGRGGKRPLRPDEINEKFDRAVDGALRWLAAHQSPNGGWEAKGFGRWCDRKPVVDQSKQPDGPGKAFYDVGVTGLALQAFLGAGYTNRGKHPFAKVVSRGLRYLKNVQDPEGCFGHRNTPQYIYNHAMGALAMVEAYGMTGSPIFKGSAQRALDFIQKARNPYFAWRYGIKPGDNDTSVTGWMLRVLVSARVINTDAIKRGKPAPLRVEAEAFEGVKAWLEKVTDPKHGRVGYVQRGTGPARPQELVDQFPGERSESMTAVGVVSRIHMGEDPRKSAVLKRGLRLIAGLPPIWDRASGRLDMYYWHWGTLAMFQAGTKPYQAWRTAMVGAMVDSQRKDGNYCTYKGSWNPDGPWGHDGGRVYSTAIMALCLEVRYRYSRVWGRK